MRPLTYTATHVALRLHRLPCDETREADRKNVIVYFLKTNSKKRGLSLTAPTPSDRRRLRFAKTTMATCVHTFVKVKVLRTRM